MPELVVADCNKSIKSFNHQNKTAPVTERQIKKIIKMHMMRQGRLHARPRVSISTILMGCFVFSVLLYIFYFRLRELYNDHETFEERCRSDLTNVKYQLDNVLEMKEEVDNTLSKLKKECKLQKERLQEFIDTFVLLRHRIDYCEMQTYELEIKCKELQGKLHKAKEELTGCKKTPG